MKRYRWIILLAGVATLVYLLLRMDVSTVAELLLSIGWGFLFIFFQEIVAHAFNALGWKFCYRREDSGAYPFLEIFQLRVAGDGVNYLTPTATIAGEFARASLLNDSRPPAIAVSGIVIAKCTQALAQMLFVLFGLVIFVAGKAPRLAVYERALRQTAAAAVILLGLALYFLIRNRKPLAANMDAQRPLNFKILAELLIGYLRAHPMRCALSVIFFLSGFAWGGFEAYWICRFLGIPIGVSLAMAIEVLSCFIDGLTIWVPAKIGSQEAGKVLVFSILGLPLNLGLAFGLARHLRELAWAVLGLILFSSRSRI